MTPERWEQVSRAFFEVIELEPPEQSRYVERFELEDPDIAGELRKLLVNDTAATTEAFLDPAHLGAVNDLSGKGGETRDALIGRQLGPYRIESLIGEGGMGNVYLATRVADYEQSVALKVVRRGMDSELILRRFRDEMKFLATMSKHPNIATLLDAGETEDGLPYFVMEYVEGERIDRYCDAARLDVRARLRLFRAVCAGLEHAHRHAVIHRDLKPGNILVTREGTAKLIDFGIAKIAQPDADDAAAMTRTADRFLTPDFASPEQIRGDPVTTASDVYSLGVVLYLLLTGFRPYKLASRALREIERAVLETQPQKPSTAIAQTRHLAAPDFETPDLETPGGEQGLTKIDGEPARRIAKLRRQLRGDVDNIVLKALSKEPARRYASVEQFSEDVRRHLAGLPVLARKDTFAYRSRKFIRRNKIGVSVALVLVLSLVGGLLGTTTQWRRAERALDTAGANEERAIRNFTMARDAVDRYVKRVADDPRLKKEGLDALRRDLLGTVVEFYDKFVQEESDDPRLEKERGEAYIEYGYITREIVSIDAAITAYENSRRIFDRLVAEWPDVIEYRRLQAEASASLAEACRRAGKYERAVEEFRHAIAFYGKLARSQSADVTYRKFLASTQDGLARLFESRGQDALAEESYLASIATLEALSRERPDDSEFRTRAANTRNNLAILYRRLDRVEDSVAAYQAALVLLEQSVEDQPDDPEALSDFANTNDNLGNIYRQVGMFDKAEVVYSRAKEIRERVQQQHPDSHRYRHLVAASHGSMGQLRSRTGPVDESEFEFRAAKKIWTQIVAERRDVPFYRDNLAFNDYNLGALLATLGRTDEALAVIQEALSIWQKLAEQFPDVPDYRFEIANSLAVLAPLHETKGDRAAADAAFEQAINVYGDVVEGQPGVTRYAVELGSVLLCIGDSNRRRGLFEDALERYAKASEILEGVLKQRSKQRRAALLLRDALWGSVTALDALGRGEETAIARQRALDLDANLRAALVPERPPFHLARSLAKGGDEALAVRLLERAIHRVRGNGSLLYASAAVYALAAGTTADQTTSREYVARSMELLQSAKATTYFELVNNNKRLQEDEDFRVSRESIGISDLLRPREH